MNIQKIAVFIGAWLLGICLARADVVEMKDGTRIVGKITQIDGTTVAVDTTFAGTVKIKQSEVVAITTDIPFNIRLRSGTVLMGTLASPKARALTVKASDGSVDSTVDNVVAVWSPGQKDPALVALQRVWSYDAAVDLIGKTGNSEQLGTGLSFRAVLAGPQDKLQFYTAYDRQVSEGQISADQFKAGIDYQNNFGGVYSWYLRDEAGFDRVKLIDFSNIAAAGLGYDFIKKPKHTLMGRFGFAHRFESYRADPVLYAQYSDPTNPGYVADPEQARRLATHPNVNSAGLDIGLEHAMTLTNFNLVNRLSFVPTFQQFSDYRAEHESYIELPLRVPFWKLRVGLENDYASKPAQGKRRLDTTYYTHLLLTWK